jgi:hypothetical protein
MFGDWFCEDGMSWRGCGRHLKVDMRGGIFGAQRWHEGAAGIGWGAAR